MATLLGSVIAPFAPVTFWHVIVADYLTSMAKVFSDVQITVCQASFILKHAAEADDGTLRYIRSTELWERGHGACAGSSANSVMLALPFWWRLMQCLRVYAETGEQKNLWNALKCAHRTRRLTPHRLAKAALAPPPLRLRPRTTRPTRPTPPPRYSTAFPLVYMGFLRRRDPSASHDHLFVLAAVVQSTYCFVWDVVMDWGLPLFAEGLGSRHGSRCRGGMRETLLVACRG